ncbi:hypothetical protein MBLNU457_g0108t1 [Dothideomycetes sp. NU457]
MTSRSNARVQAPLNGLFPPPSNDDPFGSARTSQSNVSLEEGEEDYTEDLGEDQYGEDDDEFAGDDQWPGEAMESLPPFGLKDISSLASWTVSSAKQGCGVAALRSPDTSLFWQSDGPQPHTLAIHFFKLVSIVHMRIYLDHENDESYTPTKMQFWAGMGIHDLQEFAEMTFEQPKGWIDVDFSKVGPIPNEEHDIENRNDIDWRERPVLRAFLVQVRIIENHQNGKDTHLRGLQIFARDKELDQYPSRAQEEPVLSQQTMPVRTRKKKTNLDDNPILKASWMMDPELR